MIEYIRNDLKDFKPYKVNIIPYRVKLDANESPYDLPEAVRMRLAAELLEGNNLNLYPDSDADILRKDIAKYFNISTHEIVVGAGSDELIRIITSTFIEKGEKILCPTPSFGMYSIFTRVAGGTPVEIPLKENFDYDMNAFYKAIDQHHPKLIFICSPNNPTGNTLGSSELLDLVANFNGIVVIDEAYGEFCGKSVIHDIIRHPNGIVLKTFSKALGLAGLRIGYAVGNKDLVDQIYKVKSPYNINSFSQRAAELVLENMDIIEKRISAIVEERERLYREFSKIKKVQAYPSKANFILIRVADADRVRRGLMEQGILVRSFANDAGLKDCLRITVGTKEDNDILLQALEHVLGGQ
jgi:histidinol-phosphate aminotransferase